MSPHLPASSLDPPCSEFSVIMTHFAFLWSLTSLSSRTCFLLGSLYLSRFKILFLPSPEGQNFPSLLHVYYITFIPFTSTNTFDINRVVLKNSRSVSIQFRAAARLVCGVVYCVGKIEIVFHSRADVCFASNFKLPLDLCFNFWHTDLRQGELNMNQRSNITNSNDTEFLIASSIQSCTCWQSPMTLD